MIRAVTLLAFILLFALSDHSENAISWLGGGIVFAITETLLPPIWNALLRGTLPGERP